jgi:NNP family nitrate/nitrite transporter-like MFS transporter
MADNIAVANSNIVALCATLLVRVVAGPACDFFGPRKVFAATLLIGAIPTFLSGTIFTVNQLYATRFFIGILGGSFVPCQVWTTGFYDKNIIGTANAITGGLGNSGGGITYFIMPAVFESLTRQGLTPHVAWRVSFVVPGILIVFVGTCLLLLCEDTPTGKWADRAQAAENNLRQHAVTGNVVAVPGAVSEKTARATSISDDNNSDVVREEKKLDSTRGVFADDEAQMGEQQMLDTARGEIVQKPTWKESMRVILSLQTLCLGLAYACTFGAELAVNSQLGTFYKTRFPQNGLQGNGAFAAMFGILNFIFRPLGGVVADLAYKATGSVWSKKLLMHLYAVLTGIILLVLGLTNPAGMYSVVLTIGLALGFVIAGANGLNFSVVPHVHPHANGIVSGITGAMGNFGGIIFAIVFRYTITPAGKPDTPHGFWIIGAIIIAVQAATFWIPPIPKGQIGGR